jgi:hypothetical protein
MIHLPPISLRNHYDLTGLRSVTFSQAVNGFDREGLKTTLLEKD